MNKDINNATVLNMGLQGLLFLVLWLLVVPSYGLMTDDSDDLCAPFADTPVQASSIEQMLAAADEGMLYRIETKNSRAGFSVLGPVGLVEAEFKHFSGGVALLDKKADKVRTMVALDVGSLESDTILVASMLKSKQFLDAESFPKIVFTGHEVEWITPYRAVLKGELSMHGVTQTVAFYVEVSQPKDNYFAHEEIKITASTTISRVAFGLNALPGAIDDKVNLTMAFNVVRYRVEYL